MSVVGMLFLVVLEGLKLLAEVANLGIVSFSLGRFEFALVLLDVFVDGFHGIFGVFRPMSTHTPYGRCAVLPAAQPPTSFPYQHSCRDRVTSATSKEDRVRGHGANQTTTGPSLHG